MIDDTPLPELETGWLPTTPVGDTYLRRYLLNWQGMCAATAGSLGGISGAIPGAHLADARRPAPFTNCATLTQPLAAETVEATLAEIAAFYELDDPSRDSELMLSSAWPTGDLRPFGWSLMGHPPLHLLPSGAAPRPSPPELRVEEVTDLQGLHAWERVGIDGFPLENLADAPAGTLVDASWLSDPRRRMWVGWLDATPVCASSVWIEHGINDVTLVATMPEARRRGYGEALTWRAALADSSLPAMLMSSDEGRPVYERMGFLPLLRLTLWYWNRAANRR